jgi:hypothetical protein
MQQSFPVHVTSRHTPVTTAAYTRTVERCGEDKHVPNKESDRLCQVHIFISLESCQYPKCFLIPYRIKLTPQTRLNSRPVGPTSPALPEASLQCRYSPTSCSNIPTLPEASLQCSHGPTTWSNTPHPTQNFITMSIQSHQLVQHSPPYPKLHYSVHMVPPVVVVLLRSSRVHTLERHFLYDPL